MKALLLPLLLAPLMGQTPLRIVGVERRGLPPFEDAARFYRLDGGESAGLKVGDLLSIHRPGSGAQALLKVVELNAEEAWGMVDGVPAGSPLKGDLALKWELSSLPGFPELRDPGLLPTHLDAPPQEGLLWFLPHSSELSPAGRAKLAGWVEAWGREGHWTILIGQPQAPGPLRSARGQALAEALKSMDVDAEVELSERTGEGGNHPAWIRRKG